MDDFSAAAIDAAARGGSSPSAVTPELLDSLRHTESGGDPYAVNKQSGAMGPYQFMPGTVAMLHKQGIKFNPFDEREARGAAASYLGQLVSQNGGDVKKALAQYGGFVTKDPSAYVAKVTGGAAPAPSAAAKPDDLSEFSPDAIHAAAVQSIPTQSAPTLPQGTPADAQRDMTAHAVSSMVAPLAAGYAGIGKGAYTLATTLDPQKALKAGADAVDSTQNALTYQPRTQGGEQAISDLSTVNPVSWLGKGVAWLGDKAGGALADMGLPGAGALVNGGTNAAAFEVARRAPGAVSKLRDIGKPVVEAPRIDPTLDPAKPRYRLENGQPVLVQPDMPPTSPAAPVAISAPIGKPVVLSDAAQVPGIDRASPELQARVQQAVQTKTPVNADALKRHIDAETLPIPGKLTEGQALQDPSIISNEMNGRGKAKPTVSPDFYNQQGKVAIQNLDYLRNNAAPQATGTNHVEHGQVLVDQYKAADAAATADIRAKYKALADANGGNLPLSGTDFVNAADAALAKSNKNYFLPKEVKGLMEQYREGGPMTFDNFENLRTILAAEARKAERAGDGNAAAAVGQVRNQLEALPMPAEAAGVKPLADAARQAAKARFDRIKADPAYKAVVNDDVSHGEPSPLADKFVQKYIINGTGAGVKQMKTNIGADPVASDTIARASMDYLDGLAKTDKETGRFGADRYNQGLRQLRPKLGDLVDPNTGATLEQLGRFAKYSTAQPRGGFINNSNTLVGAMSDMAKSGLEMGINAKTGIPLATLARKGMQFRSEAQAAKRATEPGAGIESGK